MARRPKNKSLLEIAITGDWKVSAIFAAALCIIIFVVIPTVTNPMLRPVALGLKPIGLKLRVASIMQCAFVTSAIYKWMLDSCANGK